MKKLTISGQYFKIFCYQKKDICNRALSSQTAQLQIYWVDIILRLHVEMSLTENSISYHF